jgi:hypothetical protein
MITSDRSAPLAVLLVSLLILSSCNEDRVPTTPTQFAVPTTPASRPQQASPEPQTFRVSGAVTGDRGAQGYELCWRSLIAGDNSSFIENFRLQRIQRVTARDSIAVSFAPDIGECPGWVAQVCGTVRVVALAQGKRDSRSDHGRPDRAIA